MVAHRRTVSKRGSVLPGWFFVVTALLSLVGTGVLGYVAYDALRPAVDADAVSAPPTSATPTPTPTPTPSPTPSPTPTPTPSPTPSPTPEASRDDIAVVVLNATRITGLAAQVGGRVTQAGWTLSATGNWRAAAAQTAVHHPPGREAEAQLLAEDLGIPAVSPSVQGMAADRLTVLVLSLP